MNRILCEKKYGWHSTGIMSLSITILHLPICSGNAADSWQWCTWVQFERPTTSKQLSLLLSAQESVPFWLFSHLFPWLKCSLISFPTLPNAHFDQSPFTSDTWIDFMLCINQKTLQAVQRIRVKTTGGTIVQPDGPWLESGVAELLTAGS